MKKLFVIAILILSFQMLVFAENAPQIVKASVTVRTYRDTIYWKQPNTNDFWCWTAGAAFDVTGEITDSSFINVEFTMPDGKKWFDTDITLPPTPAGKATHIDTGGPPTHLDKRNILDTGIFGIKLTLKNGLSGTSQELYKGRFTVKKFHVGNNLPAFKNQFEYYVDQDWRMPIGFLTLANFPNSTERQYISSAIWFRGDNADKLAGYLFYNGKQIASTKDGASGALGGGLKIMTSGNDAEPRWEQYMFSFFANKFAPGNYEIKVLHDGELSRSMNFTVGTDGAIVDNGIADKNNLIWKFMVLPVKIIDAKTAPEFPFNAAAWKTDTFYGNPLIGFTAIQ